MAMLPRELLALAPINRPKKVNMVLTTWKIKEGRKILLVIAFSPIPVVRLSNETEMARRISDILLILMVALLSFFIS